MVEDDGSSDLIYDGFEELEEDDVYEGEGEHGIAEDPEQKQESSESLKWRGVYTRHEPCRLKIKPTKTIQEKDGILKEQENILEWEKLPGKRKFGINNEYIYEDEEGIPKMKRNPYARKPQSIDKYEGMI